MTVIPVIPTTKPPAVCSQPVCVVPCAPPCPQVCCKKYKILKVLKRWARSNIEKPKKNCSCFLECGIQSHDNKEKCSERCKCKPVLDVPPQHKSTNVLRKKTPGRSNQHILQIHKLFSKWFKKTKRLPQNRFSQRNQSNLTQKLQKDKAQKARYDFIEKLLKNYEYYRRKQHELKKIRSQHIKVNRQRKNLQTILDSRKKQINRNHSKQLHKNAKDQAPASLPENSKQTESKENVNTIKKQLAALKIEQKRLLAEQDIAERELQKEEDFFNKLKLMSGSYDNGRIPDELMKAFTSDPIQQYQDSKHEMEQFQKEIQLHKKIQNQEMQEEQLYLTPQEVQTVYASRQNALQDDGQIRDYSDEDARDTDRGIIDIQDLDQRYENMQNGFQSSSNAEEEDDGYDDTRVMYGPVFH